jgi:hypothetical protein
VNASERNIIVLQDEIEQLGVSLSVCEESNGRAAKLCYTINPVPTWSDEDGCIPPQDDERLTALRSDVASGDRQLDFTLVQRLSHARKVRLRDGSDSHARMIG